MNYSQGVAPYYDLFARPTDAPGEAAAFLCGLVNPGDSVLDIGAGTGVTAVALAERGIDVTALEPDPEMHAVLLARLAGRFDIEAKLTPVRGGAGFRTRTRYDVCSSISVLHLLAAPEQEALVAHATAEVEAHGRVVLELPVETSARVPRAWSVNATRTLGRLRIEHHSAMARSSGGVWQTHWRFVSYLDGEKVHEVDRTFDWLPLSHARTEALLRMHNLAVVGDFAGFDRQPYAPGESRVRLVVARPV